ncbi:Interferon regulatory factor 2 [Mactra antiquata]
MMDDPESSGLFNEGPSEPRITNRAQGGARSDKTRFIRPVERQRMRPWLIGHLDENDIPGLVWQDKREKIFRISWKHAANQCFNMQKDTNLFERWAIHTGRHQDSDHKRWKANFRCALNSLPDVAEMKEFGVKKGNNAYKVYRFLNEREVKRGKDTKPRKRKEPSEFDDDVDDNENDGGTLPEELDYFSNLDDQPGPSSESDLSTTNSAIPDLSKLVPQGSSLDFNVESKGLKHITGNMDSLQEILAAATASLAAGSDALALEKISIEQLSHLGEASKVKLDIRQSDRKRRKKDVTGILYVFLCHWCEKVFPSRVDLFQHFLVIHQDKLLSGEEYKMKRETLQQEIEDLEKKVLGFTQENIQPRDTEEVIEDGQVVDMSSNNSMTSQEIYIEDQALDLSIAGAMAKHSSTQPEVALDLSTSNNAKQKTPHKNVTPKSATKRRRSSAMDVDYTVKFGNYGLAGAPRTKRQLSLLLKKKEEEEEKQRKLAEAQHSMEDIAHAEILISLKSAPNEDNETESIELDDKAVKEAMIDQAKDVNMTEGELDEKSNYEFGNHGEEMEVAKDQQDISSENDGDQNKDCATNRETATVSKLENDNAASKKLKNVFKCGICMENFDNILEMNQHLKADDSDCVKKLVSLGYVPETESKLPQQKPDNSCLTCGEQFDNIEDLTEHRKTHDVNHYSCEVCGKLFMSESKLDTHKLEHGIPEQSNSVCENVNEKGAAQIVKSSNETDVPKNTGQKNLHGEPVVSPAAGSKTITGQMESEVLASEKLTETDKDDDSVNKDNGSSKSDVAHVSQVAYVNSESDKSEVRDGNDVVDGEHLELSTDNIKEEHVTEVYGNIPKTMSLLSSKANKKSAVGGQDELRKDMVLCGLCNLRLCFKDIQSHLESHKSLQDRKKLEIRKECPCMICEQMIPTKVFYTHLKSHSVYDLSKALSKQMTADVSKGQHVCNLCSETFDSRAHLVQHVKSHLRPRDDSETMKTPLQKKKISDVEKKSKKKGSNTKSNSQPGKIMKKKSGRKSSNLVETGESEKLVDTDDKSTGNVKSESPVLMAALNRKPKCETSIMALFASGKMSGNLDHISDNGQSCSVSGSPVTTTMEVDETDHVAKVSKSAVTEVCQDGEEAGDFLTPVDKEHSSKVSDGSDESNQPESEENSITQRLQQKILLVRHGDVKVATPFFGPVTSTLVESSNPSTGTVYGSTTSDSEGKIPLSMVLDNIPKLNKDVTMSPSVMSTATATSKNTPRGIPISIPKGIPLSLVRNVHHQSVGKNAPLKTINSTNLVQNSSTVAVKQQTQQQPGVMNIVMAKPQTSSSKPVVVPAFIQSPSVKSPLFQLAFVSANDKSLTTSTHGVNTSPLTGNSSTPQDGVRLVNVSQNSIFTCNLCKQPLSSIEQVSSHVCSSAVSTSPGQQVVSVTLKARASATSESTNVTDTKEALTSVIKKRSYPAILKHTPTGINISAIGTIPSASCNLPVSNITVQSPPVGGVLGIGGDKPKFVLSRSAILYKTSSGSITTTVSSQVLPTVSSCISSPIVTLPASNLLRTVSTSQVGSPIVKEAALTLYPCSICRQIYMRKESFMKHMQEHVLLETIKNVKMKTEMDSNQHKTVNQESNTVDEGNNETNIDENNVSSPTPVTSYSNNDDSLPQKDTRSQFSSDLLTSLGDDTSRSNPFKCHSELCSRMFSSVKDMDVHYAVDHAHKCKGCLKHFISYGDFEKHLEEKAKELNLNMSSDDANIELSGKPMGYIVCECCNVSFIDCDSFLAHFENDYLRVVYKCYVCLKDLPSDNLPESQTWEISVTEHIREHHVGVNDQFYFCHYCYYIFPREDLLSLHKFSEKHLKEINRRPLIETGTGTEKKVKLPVKHKKVKKVYGMSKKKYANIMDMKLQEREKFLTCDVCYICFSSSFQLKVHKAVRHRSHGITLPKHTKRNIHTSGRWEKLPTCEICGKRFYSLDHLYSHRKYHKIKKIEILCKAPPSPSKKLANLVKQSVSDEHSKKSCESSIEATSKLREALTSDQDEIELYLLQTDVLNCKLPLQKVRWVIEQLQSNIGEVFKCYFCLLDLASCELLKQHLVDKHSQDLCLCVDCEKYFCDGDALLEHRKSCAIGAFSLQNSHGKVKYMGCSACFSAFIDILSLMAWLYGGSEQGTPSEINIISKFYEPVQKLKQKLENKEDGHESSACRKFICVDCTNEYMDIYDLYAHMRLRLKTQGASTETPTPSNCGKTFFYCNRCEAVICHKAGQISTAVLQHPCMYSETLI